MLRVNRLYGPLRFGHALAEQTGLGSNTGAVLVGGGVRSIHTHTALVFAQLKGGLPEEKRVFFTSVVNSLRQTS